MMMMMMMMMMMINERPAPPRYSGHLWAPRIWRSLIQSQKKEPVKKA